MSYRIVQYLELSNQPALGLVVGNRCYALEGESMSSLLQNWEASQQMLSFLVKELELGRKGRRELELDRLRLMAPVPKDATIYAAGANYRDHVEAMARALKMKLSVDPKAEGIPPWHFIKPGRATLAGHRDKIKIPPGVKRLDWEAELAVIIGSSARCVSPTAALKHVAGYTCANDLSARDQFVRRQVDVSSPFHFDWVGHKVFPGSCPLGPALTPATQVASPESLEVRLWLNGSLKQDSNTSNHLYDIAEQISFLSSRVELLPGDVILTGTPAGVGMESGTFINPGDSVRVEISGLGTLENAFVS